MQSLVRAPSELQIHAARLTTVNKPICMQHLQYLKHAFRDEFRFRAIDRSAPRHALKVIVEPFHDNCMRWRVWIYFVEKRTDVRRAHLVALQNVALNAKAWMIYGLDDDIASAVVPNWKDQYSSYPSQAQKNLRSFPDRMIELLCDCVRVDSAFQDLADFQCRAHGVVLIWIRYDSCKCFVSWKRVLARREASGKCEASIECASRMKLAQIASESSKSVSEFEV